MFDDVWIIYYSTNNTERSTEAADLSDSPAVSFDSSLTLLTKSSQTNQTVRPIARGTAASKYVNLCVETNQKGESYVTKYEVMKVFDCWSRVEM